MSSVSATERRNATPRSIDSDWLDSERAFYWVLALGALLCFIGLGFRDPWPADEPRFAQVAREMVESGRWLFPTRGGELYSDKPPVFMWLIAAFYTLTGNLRMAFLLPSALAGIGTLWLVHDLARRLWDVRIANVAGLLLIASLQFMLQARTAQIDALVCFWVTLGAYGLFRHLVAGPAFGWYLAGWFAMGLGIITKGVGFLPIFLLVPWIGLRLGGGRERVLAFHKGLLLGPLALLAGVALWFLPMLLAVATSDDPMAAAYRDDILFRQTAKRYADSWSHLNPWYYFLVSVIPLFWLPTSTLLPFLVKPWRAAFEERDPRIVMPLVQIVLVLLFFSASPGKRGVYVLPAVPMLILAAAPYLEGLSARRGPRLVIAGVLGLIAMLLLVAGVAGLAGLPRLAELAAEQGVVPWSMLATVGGFALIGGLLAWRGRAAAGWFAFVVPFWLIYGTWGYALVNPIRTPASVYRTLLGTVGDDIRLGLVDFREQWLLFAPVPVTHFGFNTLVQDQGREAWRWLGEAEPDGRDRYLLVAARQQLECFEPGAGIDSMADRSLGTAHSRDWRLLSAVDRGTDCPAPDSPVQRFDYEQPGALTLDP